MGGAVLVGTDRHRHRYLLLLLQGHMVPSGMIGILKHLEFLADLKAVLSELPLRAFVP